MPKKEDPLIRFHRKNEIDPISGCWLWNSTKDKNGYGVIGINKKTIKAHRFSYETFIGPLDTELEICHSCNCKSCVRPDHLRQDTKSSNAIDRVYDYKQNGQILTPEQVKEIKKELQNAYYGINNVLAKKYGVHNSLISDIKLGKRWSHLTID